MTGFDIVALVIVIASALAGMWRGLVREVLSLVAFVAAAVAAILWGPIVHETLAPWIDNSLLRMALGYAGVFLLVLIGVGVINLALGTLIEGTGLAPADRGLGGLFGLLRGLLIMMVLVIGAGYTPMPAEPWWRNAWLAPPFERAAIALKSYLPETVAAWVPYPYQPPAAPGFTPIVPAGGATLKPL